MELKDYTTEELREELKRRAKEARLNAHRSEPEYKEFTAIVKSIDKSRRPFKYWLEKSNLNDRYSGYQYHYYTYKVGAFNNANMPQVGDKVKLTYRRTKVHFQRELFDILKARIVEVIKRKTD